MNVEEVAKYLHLTPKQVKDLVLYGEIPCEKSGDRVSFRRVEVDAWASQRLLGSTRSDLETFHTAASAAKAHDLSESHAIVTELLQPAWIRMDLQSRTKVSVIRDMVGLADETGRLNNVTDLQRSIEEREAQCSTALGGGVALLHPQHHDPYMFDDSFVALGRTVQRVHFGSPDDQRSDIFFLVCCQADDIHLHVLARISMMCYHTSLLYDLRQVSTAQEAYDRLLEAEQEIISEKKR